MFSTPQARGLSRPTSCTSRCTTLPPAAGCIVVVYNPTQNKQTQFLRARQPICSIAVSPDGCLVAAGQRGKTAPVTVWNAATGTVVWELSHHSAGVAALAFSPDGRCLVSCGFRVDKALSVWDVATGRRVGSGKLSQKVTSLTFAESGGRFVTAGALRPNGCLDSGVTRGCSRTAGERHLKFWSLGSLLEDSASSASARALGGQGSDGPVPLTSKAAGMRGALRGSMPQPALFTPAPAPPHRVWPGV